MANTLTGLIPVIYEALDTVSREMVGFTKSVGLSAKAEGAALNQTIRVPIVPSVTGGDITPGQQPANDGDANIGYADVVITKARYFPIRWEGEEQKGIGGQYNNVLKQQFAQAIRAAINEVEKDIGVLYKKAGTSAQSAGFNTADNETIAKALATLKRRGAPESDLHLVLDVISAGTLRGKNPFLFKVNEAGSAEVLRNGALTEKLMGFWLHESAGVATHATSTAADYLVDGAVSAGATQVIVKTGTGDFVEGDIIKFGSATESYVVKTWASSTKTITLTSPLLDNVANGAAVTKKGVYTGIMAYDRNAIQLAVRPPALPAEGDMAQDVMNITDPVTGITIQVALYKEYRRVRYELGLCWGAALVQPLHAIVIA